MPFRVFSGSVEDIADLLNGVVRLGPFPSSGLAVGALTLVFNTPAVVVTFSGVGGDVLTLNQIRDEIAAAAPAANPRLRYELSPAQQSSSDRLVYLYLNNDGPLDVDSAGTANALLGLSIVADTLGTPVPPADFVAYSQGLTAGHYAVIIAP